MIPTFIFKALHQQQLPLENNGIATRDFIHVDDIAEGLIACALNGVPGGVYNLASGVETSIRDLAVMINEMTANPAALDCVEARAWDRSGKRHGDPAKSAHELGFKAKIALPDGLLDTVQWTQQNMATIKRCIGNHVRYVPEVASFI